jgi:membrane fusion protein (multidrug efflux system)
MSARVAADGVAVPAVTSSPFSRRRLALIAALLATLLGLAWYGHDWWTSGRFIESTDDSYVGGNVTELAPHVAGFVTAIAVRDNQYVHAGQVLIRLDDRDEQAGLARAHAMVDEREASLATLQDQYALQQTLLAQASADLRAQDANARFARQDDRRYRNLARIYAGSQQQAQKSSAANDAANAEVSAADAGLQAARQQLRVLDGRIKGACAAIAQAHADLQTAQLNLDYTTITAPLDGYVGDRAAQIGAYVTPGAAVLSIAPATGLWVDGNFKESDLAHVRPGQTARIVTDILPGHVFHGHVLSIAPATGAVFSIIPPENATGNFTKIVQRVPVRIALDQAGPALRLLRAGLSATVSIDTKPQDRH